MVINVREKDKAEKEEKECWQRVEVAILDWMAWAGLSQKVTREQSPGNLDLPLQKRALCPRGGARGRGLIAKEAVAVPGWSPHFRADYICAPGIVQYQLPGTTSSSPACSFLWCHLVATAVPAAILPRQRARKFSEQGA